MTERLYYDDPALTRFSARVVEDLHWHGHPAVVLDRTAFYPTGGGQPHDRGTLNGVDVVDVAEREADGAVVHVLAGDVSAASALTQGTEVEGIVDRARRFDLMQQHTGQHILSAAFVERLAANTVSFHLSDEYATIDLDVAPLAREDLVSVQDLANRIVFEDRPVISRFVADEEVPSLSLRKPVAHEGPVRIVEIPGFDCSACGGTHVRTSGQIGLIKITRSERRGQETRVEFLCGGRALADYQAKNDLVMDLAREFTVGHWEVADMVHRLADELKEVRRELGVARDALLDAEAAMLLAQAQAVGQTRVIHSHLPNHGADDLKHLAQRLIAEPHTVALLAGGGEVGQNAYLVFACAPDIEIHMGNLLRQACDVVGGRGGGRPQFAQGGAPDGERLPQALEMAFQTLVDSLVA